MNAAAGEWCGAALDKQSLSPPVQAPMLAWIVASAASVFGCVQDATRLRASGAHFFIRVQQDMKTAGLVLKEEPHTLRVPRSQRGGEVIEPLVSEQWFVKMESLAAPGASCGSSHARWCWR